MSKRPWTQIEPLINYNSEVKIRVEYADGRIENIDSADKDKATARILEIFSGLEDCDVVYSLHRHRV